MPSETGQQLAGAGGRLLKGYAPFVALLLLYALVVLLTPSVAREQLVGAADGNDASPIPTEPLVPLGEQSDTGSARPSGEATPTTPSDPIPAGTESEGGADTADGRGRPGPNLSSCGPQQIPGDPYSPPCVTFSGPNGGATHRGITRDTITVSARITSDPGLQSVLAQLANGRDFPKETAEDVERTAAALIDYINERFQFYGRSIEYVTFEGRGSAVNEAIGGGQDLANSDAIKAAKEVGAFADLTAFTSPYAEALVNQGVMAFGAPYMSRAWFEKRAPMAWSIVPDCTGLAEINIAGWVRFFHGKPARFAGPGLKDKPRKLGLIAPNTPVYQQCVDDGLALLEAQGGGTALRLDYTLDPGSMSTQAGNLIDQLKAKGITSVALGTDPLLPLFLTQKANEQDYHPEWLVLGTALTDADIAAQQYDQMQWSRAFGISLLGPQSDYRATYGYQAYKQMRPDDEPSITVDIIYYQLYQFALGVQLAGPNLTPKTFAQGMFSYPGGTGLAGTWRFGPGDYTAQDDGVAIWWDPEGVSPYNSKPGRYVIASERHTIDDIGSAPTPTFFER